MYFAFWDALAFCGCNRMLWPQLGMFTMCFCLEFSWWRLFWNILETLEGGVSLKEVGLWGESLRAYYLCLLLVVLSVSWSAMMSCCVQLCYFLHARMAAAMFDSTERSVKGPVTETDVKVTPCSLSSSSGELWKGEQWGIVIPCLIVKLAMLKARLIGSFTVLCWCPGCSLTCRTSPREGKDSTDKDVCSSLLLIISWVLYVWAFCLCACLCTTCVLGAHKPEEGARSFRTGLRDVFEPPSGFWELSPSPLEEHSVLFNHWARCLAPYLAFYFYFIFPLRQSHVTQVGLKSIT